MSEASSIYGLSAEFSGKEEIVAAARRAHAAGYKNVEAYTPFPIEELPEALGLGRTLVPLITLLGGMAGGLGGFFMEWYAMDFDYPLNVGGRPYMSWPSFIPVTFELTILGAALAAVISMIALNRLPRLHHPIFGGPNFERASQDRFFLCIEAADPKFNLDGTKAFLTELHPLHVGEVWQ
ncbi:MAG TPA: DUF3341 domain-containing protein [Verrucomicrobiae bacterium]|nr:DUF3341 domain-containing protein [Verrucomicrobiae bacterium]